jgi:hypothetical protein
MSVNYETDLARQIAAAPHGLTREPAFAPIAASMTDAVKDLLDAPQSFPFDRIGLACLAWAGVFSILATVLVLTLK